MQVFFLALHMDNEIFSYLTVPFKGQRNNFSQTHCNNSLAWHLLFLISAGTKNCDFETTFCFTGQYTKDSVQRGTEYQRHTYIQALGAEMEIRPSGEYLGKAFYSSLQSNSHSVENPVDKSVRNTVKKTQIQEKSCACLEYLIWCSRASCHSGITAQTLQRRLYTF